MNEFRIEYDSLGEVRLPANAYFGAQTQRAVENFPISGQVMPRELIHAFALVKWAAAVANRDLGKLTGTGKNPLNDRQVEALLAAAREVADGKFDDQFPVNVYQTGSGTSTNMNVNEVIANRAIELAGGDRFDAKKSIHPNDHVNMGQSTNDMFPTTIHVAVARSIRGQLIPALHECGAALSAKAKEWESVLKIGRTHLIDATPLALGQELGGMARQLDRSVGRAGLALEAVLELPVGGTAVGSGINTHPQFARRVCEILAKETGIHFIEAVDHFEANAQRDGLVECHGQIRTIAATLFTVANNVRWLSSGPQTGFHEISLPDLQPGSSIMPGKVNPVMSESLMQVAARVIGNDAAIAAVRGRGQPVPVEHHDAGDGPHDPGEHSPAGRSDLGVHPPLPDRHDGECADLQQRGRASPAMATGLNPYIGYEQAAKLAKESIATGKTVRELCREQKILPEDVLEKALDPWKMIQPG